MAYLLDPLLPYISQVTIHDFTLTSQLVTRGGQISAVKAAPRRWMFELNIEPTPVEYRSARGLKADIQYYNTSLPWSFSLQSAPYRLINSEVASTGDSDYDDTWFTNIRVAARQTGDPLNTVRVVGCPINNARYFNKLLFAKGDYVQFGDSVRVITEDVYSTTSAKWLKLSEVLPAYPTVGSTPLFNQYVVWNNCYFAKDGMPVFGNNSNANEPSLLLANNNKIIFSQAFV